METSRGCWWGEKHHCIFCGLNGGSMRFRRKSTSKVQSEIRYIEREFPGTPIVATDNILDFRFLEESAFAIAEQTTFFFEVKANLKKRHFELLRQNKVYEIQLGIESLNTTCLRHLNKGCSAPQNIQSLRWSLEYGIRVTWNLLLGIPGTTDEHYVQQARLIKSIPHLTPPEGVSALRIDRFSPLFMNPSAFGISNLRPYPSANIVYRLSDSAVHDISYFFVPDPPSTFIANKVKQQLTDPVNWWKDLHDHVLLFSISSADNKRTFIADGRNPQKATLYFLTEIEREVLSLCATMRRIGNIFTLLGPCDRSKLKAAIDRLDDLQLVYIEEDYVISLVPEATANYPGVHILLDSHIFVL